MNVLFWFDKISNCQCIDTNNRKQMYIRLFIVDVSIHTIKRMFSCIKIILLRFHFWIFIISGINWNFNLKTKHSVRTQTDLIWQVCQLFNKPNLTLSKDDFLLTQQMLLIKGFFLLQSLYYSTIMSIIKRLFFITLVRYHTHLWIICL